MYTQRDDGLSASIKGYVDSLSFKRRILRYWPTTMRGDVKTFSRLYMWTSAHGTNKASNVLKIYKMLGIMVRDIEDMPKKGLKDVYMDISSMSVDHIIDEADVRTYIEQFTPRIYVNSKDVFNSDATADTDLNPDPYKDNLAEDGYPPLWDENGWITTYLTYTPTSREARALVVSDPVTDELVLSKCTGYNPEYITYSDSHDNRLTMAAMLDEDEVLFEREYQVIERTIVATRTETKVSYSDSRYTKQVKVAMRFRRIQRAGDSSCAALISKLKELTDGINGFIQDDNYLKEVTGFKLKPQLSMNAQLLRMANYTVTAEDSDSTYVVSVGLPGSYTSDDAVVEVKYDYLSQLRAKEFTREFGKHIVNGSTPKPAKLWHKVLVVVLVIIIIVVAVVLAIPSGGSSIAWADASIALVVGSLVLTGLSMYWAHNGEPGAASFAGKGAEYIGYLAMATGVAASYQSIANGWAKATLLQQMGMIGSGVSVGTGVGAAAGWIDYDHAAVLMVIGGGMSLGGNIGTVLSNPPIDAASAAIGPVTEIADAAIQDVALNSLSTVKDVTATAAVKILQLSTQQLLQQTIAYTNTLFNGYIQLIDKGPEELKDMQTQLDAQEKELELLTPETSETIFMIYTDPYGSIFEVGDVYDRSYGMLTQGRNRALMNAQYESGY